MMNMVYKKHGLSEADRGRTCDQIILGCEQLKVQKVAVTFMATVAVIEEAIKEGVNFIITHEPTWFTGSDGVDWLVNDPVYQEKKRLIETANITLWRCHDVMHIGEEDTIYAGFDEKMLWGSYRLGKIKDSENPFERTGVIYEIPTTTLEKLAQLLKETFELETIRMVGGNLKEVTRIGVLVGGSSLGLGIESLPMELMEKHHLDLLICGEITEWTLPAYVRDAARIGRNKAILILGHEKSEECGMEHMASWLGQLVSKPVIFIDSGEPFVYL